MTIHPPWVNKHGEKISKPLGTIVLYSFTAVLLYGLCNSNKTSTCTFQHNMLLSYFAGRDSDIIQLACLLDGRTFSTYIMCEQPIDTRASEVTNLRIYDGKMYHNDELVTTVSPQQGLDEFLQFIPDSTNIVLAAHNCKSFDSQVLINYCTRYNRINELRSKIVGFFDILPFLRQCFPGLPYYNQKYLVKEVLDAEYDAHNASADVERLHELYNLGVQKVGSELIRETLFLPGSINPASLAVLVEAQHISQSMADKLRKNGFTFARLNAAYQDNGNEGIVHLFDEQKQDGKIGFIVSPRILQNIINFFANN